MPSEKSLSRRRARTSFPYDHFHCIHDHLSLNSLLLDWPLSYASIPYHSFCRVISACLPFFASWREVREREEQDTSRTSCKRRRESRISELVNEKCKYHIEMVSLLESLRLKMLSNWTASSCSIFSALYFFCLVRCSWMRLSRSPVVMALA